MGETPDIVSRGLEALCAGLAARLAQKFMPARLAEAQKLAAVAWAEFASNDQEVASVIVQPNLAGYASI
jgi:hypothetical protein